VDIGDRVFIGAGSIVLPGVRIGNNVVIGAGSVVSRDIPDNVVACGNPARITNSVEAWVEKRSQELKSGPCFGEEYSVRHAITQSMRNEMNAKMVTRIGFIV
jgi:maltose O-acetyltransferase